MRQPYLVVPQKRGHIVYVNFWFPNLGMFLHQVYCVRHTRHESTNFNVLMIDSEQLRPFHDPLAVTTILTERDLYC